MLHEPAKIFALQRTIGNDTDVAGSIADFPRFPDRDSGRKMLVVEPLKVSATPDALFKNGFKRERVKHDSAQASDFSPLPAATVSAFFVFSMVAVCFSSK